MIPGFRQAFSILNCPLDPQASNWDSQARRIRGAWRGIGSY